ncbi:hypothetical protein [Melittangium boletus]|uniref:hypothetical protein n=1 Tax=Melittangium boletus TaxID=83453 RepID=UPI003DA4101F
MTVLWDDLAAVFFISRETPTARRTLAELLAIAGAEELQPDSRVEDLFSGTWAGLPYRGALVERKDHLLLWVSFGQGRLLEQLYPRPKDEHLESAPGLLLAQAFRDACDALKVDVGMFLSHNWQASDEWMAEQEWAVSGLFSIHLRAQGIGLLYLDRERVEAQSAHPVLDEHDQLPARHGRLYFSGRGRERWP